MCAFACEAANLDARFDAEVDQVGTHDQGSGQGNLAPVEVVPGGEGAQLDVAQLLVDDALGDLMSSDLVLSVGLADCPAKGMISEVLSDEAATHSRA